MPDPREFRDALLADRVDAVAHWLADGADSQQHLDERSATPLFYACTPGMVRLLLEHGADPTHVLDDGVSVLDAAANEGQLEIVRLLLRRAPRARHRGPGAARRRPSRHRGAHPRGGARGHKDSRVTPQRSRALRLRPVALCADPRAPRLKGSLHSYDMLRPGEAYAGEPYRPGELSRADVPEWAPAASPGGG